MKLLALQVSLFFLGCLTILGAPDKVLQGFSEQHPDIPAPTWEEDSNGNWKATFEKYGLSFASEFHPDGKWVETEHQVKFDQLPAAVRSTVNLKHEGQKNIQQIKSLDSDVHGTYYNVEFLRENELIHVMFDPKGQVLGTPAPPKERGYFQYWSGEDDADSPLLQSGWPLFYKVLFNVFAIFIYAYVIYYRRHHDHKMMFLLFAFNLFLFPIFLSNSLVTAGFGFTIFALLALVRLRSEAFDKAEIAYLLGAISLTFVNTMLPIYVDLPAAVTILLTAFIADSPSLWRDTFQKIEVYYRISEKEKMLDQDYLREKLAEEFQIEVREIAIDRVLKNEVRLTLMYRDLPEIRKTRSEAIKAKQRAEAIKKFAH